jgi:hypothetical protein
MEGNLVMITVQNQLFYGLRFTVRKSVLSAWHDGINRYLGNGSLAMGKKPSLTQFCLLWHGPNSLVVRFLTINAFFSIQGVVLTVILFPMAIFLRHGKVPCDVALISWRSSNFSHIHSAKFLLDPSITSRS